MAKKHEDYSMEEWRDYYNKLYQRNYDNYQQTGDSRYERAYYQYQKIVDAFNGYIEWKKEEDTARKRRFDNFHNFLQNNVLEEKYTRAEVFQLLRKVRDILV